MRPVSRPARTRRREWERGERHQLWAYLSTGTMLRAYMGMSTCRICGVQNGALEYTDGTWPERLGHYIYDHTVWLPSEVIDHAVARLSDLEVRTASTDWWLERFGLNQAL